MLLRWLRPGRPRCCFFFLCIEQYGGRLSSVQSTFYISLNVSQRRGSSDPRNQPAASISSHFVPETDDVIMRRSRTRLKRVRCLDNLKNKNLSEMVELEPLSRRRGKLGECAKSPPRNEDLHSTKKQPSSPEGQGNNKGDANRFQEEAAHSCPDHNQWRTNFEVEVVMADDLAGSLHASPLASPDSAERLKTERWWKTGLRCIRKRSSPLF